MLKKWHTLKPTMKMSPFHTLPGGGPKCMALKTHDHMCFGVGENLDWSIILHEAPLALPHDG